MVVRTESQWAKLRNSEHRKPLFACDYCTFCRINSSRRRPEKKWLPPCAPTGAEEISIGHLGVPGTIVARVSLRVNWRVETRPRLQAAGCDDCFCFRAENRASNSMTSSSGTGQKLE